MTALDQETAVITTPLTIDEMPWVDPATLPPSDLPSEDGEPMESPWHWGSGPLLKAAYIAAHGGEMIDYYVGVNMFVYYSWKQVRNNDFKGPDLYFVLHVDGQKQRSYWATWDEDGRYPDVVIELLSASTEREDLETKRAIYEERFRLREYFCIAPQVERLFGWRVNGGIYHPVMPDHHGRIWSEHLQLWIGPWRGVYLGETHVWPRFYYPDGSLVLLQEESAKLRADEEKLRADALTARVATLEAELAKLRADS